MDEEEVGDIGRRLLETPGVRGVHDGHTGEIGDMHVVDDDLEVDAAIDNLQLKPLTLIPRRGVQEIRKFCENRNSFLFGVEEKQAVLKSSESLLVIRLIEGDFPDFQGLLDSLTRENTIRIDRNRFLESLKRINLFTEDMFHAIKMEVNGTTMVLTSQNADFGSARDEFEVEYAGEPLVLGFNCRYFIDSLQVM